MWKLTFENRNRCERRCIFPSSIPLLPVGGQRGIKADTQVFDGIGDKVLSVDFQLGDVYQDAARIIYQVVTVMWVAPDDHLVQCDLFIVGSLRNQDRPSSGCIILNFVQVIDHQPVSGFARRQESAGNAILKAPQGIVFM